MVPLKVVEIAKETFIKPNALGLQSPPLDEELWTPNAKADAASLEYQVCRTAADRKAGQVEAKRFEDVSAIP